MKRQAAVWILCLLLPLSSPATALAAKGDCGQPSSTGSGPATSDALAALRGAVGSPSACDSNPCICDVTGDGNLTTADAQRILRKAVGQNVTFSCDCACLALGAPALQASPRGAIATQQVRIEAKIVAVNKDFVDQVDLDFALEQSFFTDAGPAPGGSNGNGATLAVDSNASGGPANMQYLMHEDHNPDGALGIVNKNFVSPFGAIKTSVLLPGDGCVDFDDDVTSAPSGFPNVGAVANVPPSDFGYGMDTLIYDLYSENVANALLGTIASDNRNKILTAPVVTVFSGQSVLKMVDDVQTTVQQTTTDFRTRIQAVTMNPFAVFTGVTVDVTPEIDGTSVNIGFRVGTQMTTFFLSTAFMVDGMQADDEIPVLRRSRNLATVTVPEGKTLVLGGLERMMTRTIGLPLIGDLPLVGDLFTQKQFDRNNQRLIVFLTPTIVDDN